MALLQERETRPKDTEFSVEQRDLLPEWHKINQITLSSGLIPKIAEIVSTPNLVIFTSDQIYVVGSGRPIFKREISFLSNHNFYPGFVVQHQEAARPQPYIVKFALNSALSEDSDHEEMDLAPKVPHKPYWLPSKYKFKVEDLTNPQDLLRPGKPGGTHIYHSEDFVGSTLEFPADADISYLWERNKKYVDRFLEEVNIKIKA